MRDVVYTFTATDSKGLTSSQSVTVSVSDSTVLRGWQLNETNTGLAGAGIDKTALPRYTGSMYVPAGTTITGKRIDTELVLSAGNITIDRCWIRPLEYSPGMPLVSSVDWNSTFRSAQGVVLKDCDIDGTAMPNTGPGQADSVTAFEGLVTMQRCRAYGMGSGIVIRHTGTTGDFLVEGCLFHQFRAWGDPDTTGSHNECGTVRDFASFQNPNRVGVIRNCRFDISSTPNNASGALFNTASGADYGTPSPMANVTLEGNSFEHGPYNLWLSGSMGWANWRARNNRFKGWAFAPAYTEPGKAGWAEWADNHVLDPTKPDAKGAPVNP